MAQPEIIALSARGLVADVRLHVLDLAEFHVHSVILKLQSNFFFTFLDSADKVPIIGGEFKYEWITKVDDDGTWSLISSKNGKFDSQGMEKLGGWAEGTVEHGEWAAESLRIFTMFIQALYDKPYSIESITDLDELAEMADYYRALPAVSKTLTKTILRSSDIYMGPHAPWETIETTARTALKFRHKELFRNSIISIAGKWGRLEDKDVLKFFEDDPQLQKITQKVRAGINEMVMEAHKGFTHILKTHTRVRQKMSEIPTDFNSMPSYYRTLHDHDWKESWFYVQMCVGPVLKNNLTFDDKEALVGHGQLMDYFLCGVLEDEDLPWDLNAEDW